MADGRSSPRDLALRQRRQGMWLGAAAVGVLLVVGVLVTRPGTTDTEQSASVGSAGPSTTVDTTPFTLYQPGGDGSTTLPEGFLEPDVEAAPTTTSTTLPLPVISEDDPACLAALRVLETARRAGTDPNPTTIVPYALLKLDEVVILLRAADTDRYAEAIDAIREVRRGLADATTSLEIMAASAVFRGQDPRFDEVAAHTRTSCPELPI